MVYGVVPRKAYELRMFVCFLFEKIMQLGTFHLHLFLEVLPK
eukprot:UN28158